MRVSELMSKQMVCIDVDQNLRDVRRLMEKHNISRVLVTDEGKVIGIVTEHDLARRLGTHVERRLSNAHIHVGAACTKNLIKISPETEVKRAAQLMLEQGISSLVVEQGGEVVGIVTKSDLLKALRDCELRVKDWMSSPVHAAMVGEDLLCVRKLMLEHKIKRVPIQYNGKLVGIITEGDVARALGLFRKLSEGKHWEGRMRRIRVEQVMSRELVTVSPENTLAECAELMLRHDVSGLPVLSEEKLVGIITKTDLIRALAKG